MDNTKRGFIKMVKFLSSMSQVKEVWLSGSRSPERSRKPKSTSDWDIQVVTDVPTLKLQSAREVHKFNADILVICRELGHGVSTKSVMVYPNDTHSLLNGKKK